MKIIVCSPGYQGRFGAFYYSFDKKIINGLIRAGHHVAHFPDRDIADDVFFNFREVGAWVANRRLRQLALDFRPDAIVLMHADVVSEKVLNDIRAALPGLRIANVDCDPIITTPHQQDRIVRFGAAVDRTFITSAGETLAWVRAQGLDARYIPNPTDLGVEHIDAYDTDKAFDLVYFAGAGAHNRRWPFVEDLRAATPDLSFKVFGANKQRIYGDAYFELLAKSIFSLNWSIRNDIDLYSSDRIAQLFGIGSCVCVPRSSGFSRYLGEDTAVFFDGAEDLAARLRVLKASGEWRAIAQRGQARYRQLFEGRRVGDYLVKALFDEPVDAFEWAGL